MNVYKSFVRPILFQCDPERVHGLTISFAEKMGRVGLPTRGGVSAESLRTTVAECEVASPIGLAAGFDKNGRAIPFLSRLGFGFTEVGSVSAMPSQGNPRPRLFRAPDDQAVIVNYGVPNEGARAVAARFSTTKSRGEVPLGLNIVATNTGKTRTAEDLLEDFLSSVSTLAPVASYLNINVSCPNSDAEGDFFSNRENLRALVRGIQERAGTTPVFLKVPACEDPATIDLVLEEVSGIDCIAGFMFNLLPGKPCPLTLPPEKLERLPGAVSGKPCAEYINRAIAAWYPRIDRRRHQIVAAGGIFSAADVMTKIRLGASAVQLYTALIYEGPGLVRRLNAELERSLEDTGCRSVAEAVGTGPVQ